MSRHHKTFAPRAKRFEAENFHEEEEKKYEPITNQDARISLTNTEVTQITYAPFKNRAFNKIERGLSRMKFSENGLHVLALHQALNKLGYKAPESGSLFWNKTRTELMRFQSDHGIKASGMLDSGTLLKMDELLGKSGDREDDKKTETTSQKKQTTLLPAADPPDGTVKLSVGIVPMSIKSDQEFFEFLDIEVFGKIVDRKWDIGTYSYKNYIGKEVSCTVSIATLKKQLGITDEQWARIYQKESPTKPSPGELRKSIKKFITNRKDEEKGTETLSAVKKQFIKDTLSTANSIQSMRILDLLKQLSDAEIADYQSKVSQETTDLNILEASLKSYIEERNTKNKEQNELESVKTKLYGLEGLYTRYTSYLQISTTTNQGTIKDPIIVANPVHAIAERELTEAMITNGFASIEEFEFYIKSYENAFEKETVRIGTEMLQHYKHTLFKEEKKLNNPVFLNGLSQNIIKSGAKENYKSGSQIKENSKIVLEHGISYYDPEQFNLGQSKIDDAKESISKLSKQTPLVNDPEFDKEEFAEITNINDLKEFLHNYIISQNEKVDDVITNIRENPEHIYELDNLFKASYAKQNIEKSSIYDRIITAKHEKLRGLKVLLSICEGIFALALIVVTWGAATPVVIAGGALSLAVSIDVAYDTIKEYKNNKEFHDVGLLSDDPSLLWVVIAIAGVALDAGALAAVLKSAKPIAAAGKAFNEAENATEALSKLESDLAKIEGLEERVRENIVMQAKIQSQQQKLLDGFVKAKKLTFVTIPFLIETGELLTRAVFAIQKGIVTFDSFVTELKLAKLVSDAGLNPEELVLVKQTFEEARTLAKDDKLVAELEKAIAENDVAKVKSLLYENKKLPSKLVEDQNIYRGFNSDYSKAKRIFKEYRENKKYNLKKEFSGDELALEVRRFEKRNLAYIEGEIDGFKFNSSDVVVSGNKYDGEVIFESYKVDKNGNINTDDAWSREFDTEYVELSKIANNLGAVKGRVYKNVKGEITIASELPYCISCQGVIQDFSIMFPNVKINLVDGIKNVK
ncbi:deaminase domain-containing protein [uncultured Chryseobacterium sp.]|uniref:deaminase domain-containing protein n=1 Tax=uncultured Chryseobacterium sp. TaxID=259322 RepID=UPI0025DEEE98|nr:deaminase domain-containing protein [uncultured Chryseobacterium sp.]